MFAWEAYEKGADVHLQADPTKLELLHKEYKVKKGDFEQDKKMSVLEKVRILTVNERNYWTLFISVFKSTVFYFVTRKKKVDFIRKKPQNKSGNKKEG